MHLTNPIVINHDNKEYLAGVAAAEMSPEYLQRLLLDSTAGTGTEWSCSNSDALVCYLLDDGGHLLASNQPLPRIEPGDFLGAADPQLMQLLADEEKGVFLPFVSRNFEALCPDELICCSAGVKSVFVPTINFLVYLMQNFLEVVKNLGYIITG